MLLRIVRGAALLVVGGFIIGRHEGLGIGPVGVALGLAAGGLVIVGGFLFGWLGGLGLGPVGVAPSLAAGGLVIVGGGGLRILVAGAGWLIFGAGGGFAGAGAPSSASDSVAGGVGGVASTKPGMGWRGGADRSMLGKSVFQTSMSYSPR